MQNLSDSSIQFDNPEDSFVSEDHQNLVLKIQSSLSKRPESTKPQEVQKLVSVLQSVSSYKESSKSDLSVHLP